MTPDQRIQNLLTAKPRRTSEQAADEITRQAARIAWVREIMAAWSEAQREADQAWARLLAPIPDDVPDEELEDLPEPPEQAKLDAIHAEIQAVADHDRWPRHLYWSL